jgi:spoIIIJ-associated protein
VQVKAKPTPEDVAEMFLREVLAAMGLSVAVETKRRDKYVDISLTGKNMGVLIGKHGQTLDSLQYLTNLVVNRCGAPEVSVIVDTENYRKRRRETLESLALNLAKKVKATKKNVALEPMSRYERHIIHTVLQNDKHIRTYSDGTEPRRNVIIALR